VRYLKTYEGLFNFIKSKVKGTGAKKSTGTKSRSISRRNHYEYIPDIRDCFVDLSDNGFDVDVSVNVGDMSGINVNIEKHAPLQDSEFNIEDIMESIRFTNSYIGDLELMIRRFELCIWGTFDGIYYSGDQYFDNIEDLQSFIDSGTEATNHIEYVLIRIIEK